MAAESVQLRGIRSAAFTLRTPQGSTRVELPLPGLYNVYNALGAAALCLSLGVELPTIAAGLGAVEPAFGRAETIDLDGRPTSILLVKNPAGANEVLRTLALEGGELDLFGVLNDRIADGRDVSWVWDADWETVAPHVARMTCSGTRAAELALRMKYAGVPTERLHVVEGLAAGLDHALDGRPRSALRPPHLHRAARAARAALRPRAGAGVLAMSDVIWHDIECGGYAADLPLWRELARGRGRAGARRRRRRRPRGARARPPRPRRHRARPRRRAARRAGRPRPRRRARGPHRARRRRRLRAGRGAVRPDRRPDADDPAAARARRPRARSSPPRASTSPPAGSSRSRCRRSSRPFEVDPAAPAAARPRRARRLALPLLPGRDPPPAATSWCSSACARRSPRTAAPAPPTTRSSSPA